jgi:hypothetical protein
MSGFYPANQTANPGKTGKRGSMPTTRTRPAKRGHKVIAFKAFFDTDRDILDWWEGMQDGERSDMIRDLLRGYLKGLSLVEAGRRQTVAVDGSMVLQMREDTAWIRDALNDMPAYLEALLGRLSVTAPAPPPVVEVTPVPASDDNLSDAALARRKARMGKATW